MQCNKRYYVYWGPEPGLLPLPAARCLLRWGFRMGSVVWSCPIVLALQRGSGGCPENLHSAGSWWRKCWCEKAAGTHSNEQNSSKCVVSAPFSSGRSFFSRRLTDQEWKKILRRKKRVWMATQELGKFFPVEDCFIGQTMPFMSKLKLSMETWVFQEHFILEKENLQKPLRRMEYFSLGFFLLFL